MRMLTTRVGELLEKYLACKNSLSLGEDRNSKREIATSNNDPKSTSQTTAVYATANSISSLEKKSKPIIRVNRWWFGPKKWREKKTCVNNRGSNELFGCIHIHEIRSSRIKSVELFLAHRGKIAAWKMFSCCTIDSTKSWCWYVYTSVSRSFSPRVSPDHVELCWHNKQ